MTLTSEERAVLEEVVKLGAKPPQSLLTPKQAEIDAKMGKSGALLCGRRAGKTFYVIHRIADRMERYPGSSFVYIEKTAKAARNKLFRPARRLSIKHGWGLIPREADREIHHPNGSILYLAGADKEEDIDKVRGLEQVREIWIDECGTQKPMNLEYLINSVSEPALMDTDGDIGLVGTPGKALKGVWYEISGNDPRVKRKGWDVFQWNATENPYIKAKEAFRRILEKNRWDEDNPIFIREWLGRWVRDLQALLFAFDPRKNVIDALPDRDKRWTTVLAMDFGVVHSVAWIVLAYGPYGHKVYVLHARKKAGLAPSEAADITLDVIKEWKPSFIVGDTGGLGKAFTAEFARRHGIAVKPADKQQKATALEFTSDAFRTGNLVSYVENTCLHDELEELLWNEDQTDLADGQDDHAAEALVYGYRECPAFA
jgi:hypothetical protein